MALALRLLLAFAPPTGSPPPALGPAQEAVAAKSWSAAQAVKWGTLAIVGAMSQTWAHPLLKKILPAQGEVRGWCLGVRTCIGCRRCC